MRWVLLPGFDGTGLLFEPFLRSLPAGIVPRVIAYPTDRICSANELVRIAVAGIPNDEPYVLIAESFSGPIALKVASEHLRPPVAVVLCASFATCPVSPALVAVLSFFARPVCRLRPPPWIVRRYLLDHTSEDTLPLFYQALSLVSASILASRLSVLRTFNDDSPPRRLDVPLLYLRANRDRLVNPRNAEFIQSRYRQARVETIDSPHLILQTQPAAAARAISEFVVRVAPPANHNFKTV